MNIKIKNVPNDSVKYEFIVAKEQDGEYYFFGNYENGFEADIVAHDIGGIVYHYINIQGKSEE